MRHGKKSTGPIGRLWVFLLAMLFMLLSMTACEGNEEISSDSSSAMSTVSTFGDSSETMSAQFPNSTQDSGNPSDSTTIKPDETEKTNVTKTTSRQTTTTTAPSAANNIDIAKGNTAILMNYVKTNTEAAAETMRQSILNSRDTYKPTGNTWYISSLSGNDKNDGSSPRKAWKSTLGLSMATKIKAGDAVLFERGGVYRGGFTAQEGVYYGAYGTGGKPCIYGSPQNSATVQWTEFSKNIWVCESTFSSDIGLVVFDHGKQVSVKKLRSLSELKQNYDMFYEKSTMKLYMYLDKNPAEAHQSIETGDYNFLVKLPKGAKNITIENLCLKYGGHHGISGQNNTNIVVRHCEIGWIGGCVQPGYGDGYTRLGNAFQIWENCDNILVENCWIYQVYDAGLTVQYTGKPGKTTTMKNVTFKNNLLEYCHYSIEHFLRPQDGTDSLMENWLYEGNLCRLSGYGWGEQRPDKGNAEHIRSGDAVNTPNNSKNFRVVNNTFDTSLDNLFVVEWSQGDPVVFSGNTYMQYQGTKLGTYHNADTVYRFTANIADTLQNIIGDKTAKFEYTQS